MFQKFHSQLCLREMKLCAHENLYMNFTAVVFIIAQSENNLNAHQLMNNQNVVHPHSEILFNNKKELRTNTCQNMVDPQKHQSM